MHSRRRFSTRPKSPTYWQRTQLAGSTLAGGALQTFNLGDQNLLLSSAGGSVDVRWTIRRIVMNLEYAITTGFTAGADIMVFAGIYLLEQSSTVFRDPQLLTVADGREDWLWLGTSQVHIANAGLVGTDLPFHNEPGKDLRAIDVRVARKADADKGVSFGFKAVRIDTGAAPAAGVLAVRGQISLLWSQTNRR